jgi:hypothetical protein
MVVEMEKRFQEYRGEESFHPAIYASCSNFGLVYAIDISSFPSDWKVFEQYGVCCEYH